MKRVMILCFTAVAFLFLPGLQRASSHELLQVAQLRVDMTPPQEAVAWNSMMVGYYGVPQPQLTLYSQKMGTWEDLATLLLLSRLSGSSPEVIMGWRLGGQPWFGIVQKLNIPMDRLFVTLPPATHIGPPYGKAYGYWKKRGGYVLTDTDIRNLALLRATSDYYKLPPGIILSQVEKGKSFAQIVVTEHRGKAAAAPGKEVPPGQVKGGPSPEKGGPPADKGGPPPWAGKGAKGKKK